MRKEVRVDYFPIWKPLRVTMSRILGDNYKSRIQALRNSSSSFIKRDEVRQIIFSRDGYKCKNCGSKNNLTVDHIVSVYQVACGKYPLEKLNTRENLQTLCKNCNSRKAP